MAEQKADIALIGLAVMGQNLIMNMNDHGNTVVAYNRTVAKVDVPGYEAACERGISGLRFGVPEEYFGEGLDADRAQARQEARLPGLPVLPGGLARRDAELRARRPRPGRSYSS